MVLDPDREVCKASFPLLCVYLWCRAWNKLSDTSGDPLIMTLGSRFIPGRSSCPTSRRQTGFVCPHLGWTSHSREPSCWWSGRCTDLKEDRDVFQITMSSGTSDDRLKHPIICETAHVFAAPPAGGAETETRQMWKLNRFGVGYAKLLSEHPSWILLVCVCIKLSPVSESQSLRYLS